MGWPVTSGPAVVISESPGWGGDPGHGPIQPARPLVDRVEHSSVQNLKELQPGSAGRSELRVLFVFDPWRSAILLVAGDKSGSWKQWYREAIPRAEHLLEVYLKERAEEEGST
jgi:hypothetical protein